MGWIQADDLKIGKTYEVEFLNGSKIVVKFVGVKGGCYDFRTVSGQSFSIAENCIQYHRFDCVSS